MKGKEKGNSGKVSMMSGQQKGGKLPSSVTK